MPGLAVVRYELFEHSNLLWSNLRGLGMPLLGNEIQAAPLFPLTWLLAFVPERDYWNVFVLARFFLAGLAAYLLAYERMRLDRAGAVMFVLTLVYALNVIRWMSHPWSNGFATGLWYVYALDRLLENALEPWGPRRVRSVLFVALAAYCLVTCGFPEGAALGAVLAVLVHGTRLFASLLQGRLAVRAYLFDLLAAHAIGLAVSSPQTFAMVEFIQQGRETLQEGWRGSNGARRIRCRARPPGDDLALLRPPRRGDAAPARRGALLLLRERAAAPCSPAVARKRVGRGRHHRRRLLRPEVLSRLAGLQRGGRHAAVLRQSYFIIYFQPLFLWVFAYFAARAMAWRRPRG